MPCLRTMLTAAILTSGLVLAGGGDALAQGKKGAAPGVCVNKAASGTNVTRDGAMFQAWEAVLQATSWGSWGSFMTSGMKVGSAPGYKVSGLTSRCSPGGLGQTCIIQATLCN